MWIRQGNGDLCNELQYAKSIAQAIFWESSGVGSSVLDPYKMRYDGRKVWNDYQLRAFLVFQLCIVSSTSFRAISMICILWINYILWYVHTFLYWYCPFHFGHFVFPCEKSLPKKMGKTGGGAIWCGACRFLARPLVRSTSWTMKMRKRGVQGEFLLKDPGNTWRIIPGRTDTWLITMVMLVSPLRIGLWDPFQMTSMAYKWGLLTTY